MAAPSYQFHLGVWRTPAVETLPASFVCLCEPQTNLPLLVLGPALDAKAQFLTASFARDLKLRGVATQVGYLLAADLASTPAHIAALDEKGRPWVLFGPEEDTDLAATQDMLDCPFVRTALLLARVQDIELQGAPSPANGHGQGRNPDSHWLDRAQEGLEGPVAPGAGTEGAEGHSPLQRGPELPEGVVDLMQRQPR